MQKLSGTRLWVILPVYGNWEDTRECLRALGHQTSAAFRVLIADDGSRTPLPAGLRDGSFVDYVRWENSGFARNCNRAASYAIDRGATHLLFLNSDTSFGPRFVEQWLEAMAEVPDAILSPLIYWFDKRSKIWFSGGKFTIWVPFVRLRRLFQETTAVDIVTACALLVPAPAWRQLNGFDPTYVTYYEDFDFALRAKANGIPIYVIPKPGLRVWHKASRSFRDSPSWVRHYRMLTSSLIFIRKHYKGPRKWICMALKGAHLAATIVWVLPEVPHARRLWQAITEGISV